MKKPKNKKKVVSPTTSSQSTKKKPGPKPQEPFRLNDQQRKEIDKAKGKTHDSRLHARLYALIWLDSGKSELEVAELLDCHRKTVHRWVRIYRKHGLAKLLKLDYKGDPGQLSRQQIDQLKEEIKTGRFHCAREVQTWINETFQKDYTYSGTKTLLHRIGCSYHKTSAFLFKADHDLQQQWLDRYQKQRTQYKGDPTVRTYFIDGVHLIWGMEIIFCCWLLVGQRLNVVVGSGRKRFNILGAYCPDGHEYLDIRSSEQNVTAKTLIELMKLLRQKHPEVKKFILHLDNARYNHANIAKEWIEEQRREGVEFVLDHVPPYSPNLNLIERLWKFLRKVALRAWHPTFEKMQAEVARVLDNLSEYREELDRLMTENFHLVPKPEIVAA